MDLPGSPETHPSLSTRTPTIHPESPSFSVTSTSVASTSIASTSSTLSAAGLTLAVRNSAIRLPNSGQQRGLPPTSVRTANPVSAAQGGKRKTISEIWLIDPKQRAKSMDAALLAVKKGNSCNDVARKYGFADDPIAKETLRLAAITDKVKQRIIQGESCLKVAIELGLIADKKHEKSPSSQRKECGLTLTPEVYALDVIEKIAVEANAKQCVENGEPCKTVANRFGIYPFGEAMKDLRQAAAPIAIERVLTGQNYCQVGQDLDLGFDEITHLGLVAEEAAGERVRKGESCVTVAELFGLENNKTAMEKLMSISVQGPAKAAIYAGKHFSDVVEQYGLSGEKALASLLNWIIKGQAIPRIHKGEHYLKVAREIGVAALEEKLTECAQASVEESIAMATYALQQAEQSGNRDQIKSAERALFWVKFERSKAQKSYHEKTETLLKDIAVRLAQKLISQGEPLSQVAEKLGLAEEDAALHSLGEPVAFKQNVVRCSRGGIIHFRP